MTTTSRIKNWILRPYLDSAHWIEEESTILVTDTFCVLTRVIQTVKYADDLVLLAKEETVLHGMIDKLIEIGSCYGMEMNV